MKMNFRFAYMDKVLLVLMLGLAVFGSVMVYSASNIAAVQKYGVAPEYFFIRQVMFIVVGIGVFIVVSSIPYRNYEKFLKLGFIVIYGMLIYVKWFGSARNNSSSWIPVGPFTIQPSEFAKLLVIAYLAFYYNKRGDKLKTFEAAVSIPLTRVLPMFFLVFLQPDLGTSMVIFGLTLTLFFISNAPKHFKRFAVLGLILGTLIVMIGYPYLSQVLTPEQMQRLDFLSPCHNYSDGGYHVCNSLIAINNGGLLGVGLGQSTQKYLYLLESHTDFIFAIVLEEMGLLFSLFILGIYGFVIFRGLEIAKKAQDIAGTMIAAGATALIFFHLVINIGGVTGFMPLTGVPLPLMSYGGSFIITTFASFGMIQSVAIKINFPLESNK